MDRTDFDPLLEPRVENDPLVRQLERAPGEPWGWVMGYGVLLLLVALFVLVEPLVASVATGLVLGVVLVVYGAAALASGWTSLRGRARWPELILGLVAVVAGIFAIANPVGGAIALVWAVGLWLLVSGGFQIAFALKARHDRGWRLFLGILDVILGLVLLTSAASIGLTLLAIIVAVSLAVRGIFLVQLALALKRTHASPAVTRF